MENWILNLLCFSLGLCLRLFLFFFKFFQCILWKRFTLKKLVQKINSNWWFREICFSQIIQLKIYGNHQWLIQTNKTNMVFIAKKAEKNQSTKSTPCCGQLIITAPLFLCVHRKKNYFNKPKGKYQVSGLRSIQEISNMQRQDIWCALSHFLVQ